MPTYVYKTQGTCSKEMHIEYEDNKIVSLKVIGGCPGNLSGISKLVIGMTLEEVAGRLQGVTCGPKPTSCPDQLARACREILDQNK